MARDGRSENASTRKTQPKAALRCYECEGIGHFARECPTRKKSEPKTSDSPGRKNPTERSRSPGGNPPLRNERKTKWEAKCSGNDEEA